MNAKILHTINESCYYIINVMRFRPLLSIPLLLAFITLFILATVTPSYADCSEEPALKSIRVGRLVVSHTAGLEPAARQVLDIFEPLRDHVRQALNIKRRPADIRVTILDGCHFQRLTGNRSILGFAYPPKNIIVIDYKAHNADIMALRATIKHELSHLMLHAFSTRSMPKWLDEGIAQWVSGGHSELRQAGDDWTVARAALAGKLMPLRQLAHSFPPDDNGLRLAYAESLSAVDYLISTKGADTLKDLFSHIASGLDTNEAFTRSTGVSIVEFQDEWEARTLRHASIYTFIKTHLYEVLFMIASIALTIGFIRTYYRLRTYKDDDADDAQMETKDDDR